MPKGSSITPRLGRPYHALLLALIDDRDILVRAAEKGGTPEIYAALIGLMEDIDFPPSYRPANHRTVMPLLNRLNPELASTLSDILRARPRGFASSTPSKAQPPITSLFPQQALRDEIAELRADLRDLREIVNRRINM